MTLLFWLIVISSLATVAVWAWERSRAIKEEEQRREEAALASLLATHAPQNTQPLAPPPNKAHDAVDSWPPQLKLLENFDLRDLILAFYAVRGYVEEWVAPDKQPIELTLRHRKKSSHRYAFIDMRSSTFVNAEHIHRLARQLRAWRLKRAVLLAPPQVDTQVLAAAEQHQLRLYDRTALLQEILDLEPAGQAKLVGMVKGRAHKEVHG